MLFEIGLVITAALFVKALNTKHEKIHGIYSQPGPFYWIKWILFYVLYRWRVSRAPRHESKYDDGSDLRYLEDERKTNNATQARNANYGAGERSKVPHVVMERTQPVADSHFAIDAVYFNGFEEKHTSIKDDVSVVLGFTARYRNFAEILFLLNIPGVGLFQHPSHPDRIICDSGSDDYSYHGQGITIEMLEPMRRWKLKYNGLMRLMDVGTDKKSSRGDNKLVHVKFALIWRSYSAVTDFDTDISASCMANAFASEEWSQDFFDRVKRYHDRQTHYEQWGQLQGVIQVDGHKPREVLLRGLRDHSFSKRDWRHFHRYLICIIHLEDGTSINASFICMDVTLSRFTMGYIIHPNHVQEDITDIDLKLWEYGEDGVIPNEVKYNFTAGGKKYSVVCQIRIISEFYNGFEWEGKVVETLADYYVNGVPGRGIAEFCYRHSCDRRTMADCPKSDVKPLPDPKISQAVLNDLLIVNLEDDLCTKEVLTGGKGSQLAVLKKWSSDTDKYTVPDGFCITTSAYQKHVKENQDLDKTIQELTNLSDISDEQIKDLCNRIHAVFLKSNISEPLRTIIGQEYGRLDSQKCPLVAVRSSAVGEDSSDLSAAGQLDTFLGLSGVDEVIQAIKKCWACQYCYNAVQYRRQHGQPAISSMGVVVQLLAENTKISGVMFTQHPVTGNPAHVLMNSNYGLGETVVSGSAEPDTIVVAFSPNNNPEILFKEVGSKANKLAVNDSGAIEQSSVESKDSAEFSLTKQQAFQLADIGRTIQSYAGGPRDIEWTISENGRINLVQARPITGDPTETEFELMHEFDSGYSNENYVMTTANIGEMMTGPVTPLTASTFARSIEYGMQNFYESGSPRGLCEYNNVFMGQTRDHLLLNYLEILRLHTNAAFGFNKGSADVNLFGRVTNVVSKDEYLRYHRNDNTFLRRLRNTATFWKYLIGSRKEFENIVERMKGLHLDGQNSKDLYRDISEHLGQYAESWHHYTSYAALSGISTTVLMMILSKGDPDWKTEHYSDVAMIYSSCEGVISASAPTLVKETAKHIYESNDKDHFISSSPEAAIEWLMSAPGKAGETFRKLLLECGHRCLREAELHEKSWASDPIKLGQSLQATVINFANEKSKDLTSVEEAIEKIKTPLTYLGRLILKWVVPQARKSIGGREWGKSNVIKVSDLFKQAYWKLAGMMQKEGYLPDADLMFFLTHGEIGRLLRTRSARLVTRAMRRRRLYDRKRNLVFGEFIPKIPAKPLNLDRDVNFNDSELLIQGLPVSIGVIEAKARVINSLEEACEIKRGEVLIVHTTDIGWSPYFPLISGLVTDIGGLISHGAIVAREYGIPCIVGTKIGTTLLKSGDHVHLDGGRGFVQKLQLNEQAAKQNVAGD